MADYNTGAKWITRLRRLAIYARDGFTCAYCGAHGDDVVLTLDHVTTRDNGGTHANDNLVTACMPCNSRRGSQPIETFAPTRVKELRVQLGKCVDTGRAREAIESAGSYSRALEIARRRE